MRQKKEKFQIICGLWQKNQKTLYISDKSLQNRSERKIIAGLKLRQMQDNELFLSGMEGKEARNCVIDICRKSMADVDGKVIIGNGFPDCEKKKRTGSFSGR